VAAGSRREEYGNGAMLSYHAASNGNLIPAFRGNLSVRNYHYLLRNDPEERSSHAPIYFSARSERSSQCQIILCNFVLIKKILHAI
jgi:hypothetical protein